MEKTFEQLKYVQNKGHLDIFFVHTRVYYDFSNALKCIKL